jgi:hypothetical protein
MSVFGAGRASCSTSRYGRPSSLRASGGRSSRMPTVPPGGQLVSQVADSCPSRPGLLLAFSRAARGSSPPPSHQRPRFRSAFSPLSPVRVAPADKQPLRRGLGSSSAKRRARSGPRPAATCCSGLRSVAYATPVCCSSHAIRTSDMCRRPLDLRALAPFIRSCANRAGRLPEGPMRAAASTGSATVRGRRVRTSTAGT